MDPAVIATVRRFNRTVTQRVGALDDHYLSRDRPLGEARVLWEIGATGAEGCDVRALRSRLEVDSGYLSRLLRSLEAAGLVAVGGSAGGDGRVRRARLTAAGLAERGVLDRGSDELAESLVAPLRASQQQRLVGAMDTVERLLTAALVTLEVVDPGRRDARHCLAAYYAELDERFDAGFEPSVTRPTAVDDMRPPAGLFLLASLRDEPVGCGVLRFHGAEPAEIKRLWVDRTARGLGVGRRLLGELERLATAHGCRAVRLDTNRSLTEAIALYRTTGYREIEAFNDEPYAHHWFEKALPAIIDG
jgi:ribosomal protein S18 acetylase RimI-like enzyme